MSHISKRTQGPWGIEQSTNTLWIGPMRADGKKVADVVVAVDYDQTYTEESLTIRRANAALIAAAPSLAEALREAINTLVALRQRAEERGDPLPVWDIHAISDATGIATEALKKAGFTS